MGDIEDEVNVANADAQLQFAISLLTPKLNEFIKSKLADQRKKLDFSQSIQMIIKHWNTLFPGGSRFDMSLFKRARKIRNVVSHQDNEYNRFQHNLECLANIASLIKHTELVKLILNPNDNQNQDTERDDTVNVVPDDKGLTEPEHHELPQKAKQRPKKKKNQNKKVNETDGASPDLSWITLKEKGNIFYQKGNWMEAMNCYTQAIHLSPNQAVLYSNRALAEINLKKYQLAREDAEDAIRLDPENVKYYRILSEALTGLNMNQEAINVCEEGLKLDPRDEVLLIRQRDCNAVVIHEEIDKLPGYVMGKKKSDKEKFETMYTAFTEWRNATPRPEDIHVCQSLEEFVGLTPFVGKAHQFMMENASGAKKIVNEKKALEIYEAAARKGSAEGLYNVALMYSRCLAGLARDFVKANELCRKAASQKAFKKFKGHAVRPNIGVAEAENGLGIAYRDGMGLDRNDTMAFQWFLKSAEHLCPAGQNNLGICLLEGNGCRQDWTSARHWFQKAADWGVGEAQVNYASMLMKGQGGPKDEEEALRMLRLAAEQGIPGALAKLQFHLRSGAGGGLSGAEETIFNLVQKDDPGAVHLLGINYWKGEGGFKVDFKLAEENLKKASQLGHSDADYHLGLLLLESTRYDEAAIHFQKAAELGKSKAQWELGYLQAFGHGCPRDEKSARRWLRRAQQQGVNTDKNVEDIIQCCREVVTFEADTRLPIEGLSTEERLDRYLCSKAKPECKDLAAKTFERIRQMLQRRRNNHPSNSTSGIRNVNQWLPLMIERAESGSESAMAFFQAHEMFAEAEEFLRNGQYKTAFQMFRLADRIWSYPVFYDGSFIVAARAMIALNPNDADSLYVLATDSSDKSMAELLAIGQRCVELDPSVPDFHHFLGCMYGFVDRFEEAIRCFDRALEMLTQPEWIYDRATALKNVPSKKREAIKAYEEFLSKNPPDRRKVPEALYGLAALHLHLGQKEKAKQFYEKAQRAEDDRLPCFTEVDANFPTKFFVEMHFETEKSSTQVPKTNQRAKVQSCAACNKANAPSRCSSCKAVFYCDSKCQKSHWKYHKTDCKAKACSK